MSTPTRPLNIMADPRVFRGSVVAKQREEMARIKKEMERRNREQKWKANVVKNRLKMALSESSFITDQFEGTQEMTLDGSTVPGVPLTQQFQQYKLARLNGPLGKRPDLIGIEPATPLSIDAKSPQATIADSLHRRSFQEAQAAACATIPTSSARVTASSVLPHLDPGQSQSALKNVRFSGKSVGVDTKLPLLPGQVPFNQRTVGANQRFRRPVPGQRYGRRAGNLPNIHSKQWSEVDDTTDPPNTALPENLMNNIGLQTDDYLAFEEAVDPLVQEVVDSVINDALRKLAEEEEVEKYQQKLKDLMKEVESEKQRNSALIMNLERQTEVQKSLEAEKVSADKKLDALDCRRIAIEFVTDLTQKCLSHLVDRNLIRDDRFTKDVAMDTRQLEAENQKLERTMQEIKRDFFPYVYQKAERVFVHQLTSSYLKDALFAKDQKFRMDAYARLNKQIHEYTHHNGHTYRSRSLSRPGVNYGRDERSPTPPINPIY